MYKRFRGNLPVEPRSRDLSEPSHLRVISDAAYKREVEDGYSLRGALFLRSPGQTAQSFVANNAPVHILDWACRSQRHVTRSTFSAELLAAGDAADQGILISHMMFELENGPLTPTEARERRMGGGYTPVGLYLDAKSVFAAIIATFIKPPAEKSLLCHVQYLRELLDKSVLQYLFWIDTRDMTSDGLTKGAVSRELLHALMGGSMELKHEYEQWSCKRRVNNSGPHSSSWYSEDRPVATDDLVEFVWLLTTQTVDDTGLCMFRSDPSLVFPNIPPPRGKGQGHVSSKFWRRPCWSQQCSACCQSKP